MPTKQKQPAKKPAKKGRKRQTVHGKLNHLNSRLNLLDKTLERLGKRLDGIEKLATGNPEEYIAEARQYHQAVRDLVGKLLPRLAAIEKFYNFLK